MLKTTVKLGYNDHGYNVHGYNVHGYNDHGYNDHGYNDHGYNDHGYKNKIMSHFWSQVIGYKDIFHGYNVITEFVFGYFRILFVVADRKRPSKCQFETRVNFTIILSNFFARTK